MKTTIEIADALLEEARDTAAREGTTVRALVESGLRQELKQRQRRRGFKLKDGSFGGQGLHPDVAGDWDKLRELAYEGRGT